MHITIHVTVIQSSVLKSRTAQSEKISLVSKKAGLFIIQWKEEQGQLRFTVNCHNAAGNCVCHLGLCVKETEALKHNHVLTNDLGQPHSAQVTIKFLSLIWWKVLNHHPLPKCTISLNYLMITLKNTTDKIMKSTQMPLSGLPKLLCIIYLKYLWGHIQWYLQYNNFSSHHMFGRGISNFLMVIIISWWWWWCVQKDVSTQ